MGFSPNRRAFLVAALGEEKVAELEKETGDKAEFIKRLGVEFKALGIDLSEYLDLVDEKDDSIGWISGEMGLRE